MIAPSPKRTNITKNKRTRRFKRKNRAHDEASNTVVNLSSQPLSDAEFFLLSSRLNFCPTPGPVNETKLSEDLDNFARSLRIKEHFGSKQEDIESDLSDTDIQEEDTRPRFIKKSTWVPKPSKNTTLESFIDNVKSDILRVAKEAPTAFDNLTVEKRSALKKTEQQRQYYYKTSRQGKRSCRDGHRKLH